MKQADIRLKLSQTHDVSKKGVTPMEVLFLVAEHHQNAGGNPVTVLSESEIEPTEVEEVEPAIAEVKSPDGKTVLSPARAEKRVKKLVHRSEDQELQRLRTKYGAKKLNIIASQVREFPKDFKSAIERGIGITLPSGGILSETKLI